MRNTRFLIVALALLLALSVSGLVAAQSQVEITLAGWASSPAEDQALNDALTNFMAANPDIKVTFTPSSDFPTTMQTAFASGDYANVFYVDSSKLPDWAAAGVIAPAEGHVDDVEDIYPSLRDVFTVNGVLQCVPKDFSTLALEYNKDMFDAAGLAYPDDTWTWDNLKDAAAKLTTTNAAGEKVLGLALSADAARWFAFFYQANGALFDDSGALTLNSPAGQEAMDYYVGLASDGSGGTSSQVDSGWPGEALGKGRVAMATEGNWIINFMNTTYPDIHWGVAPLPSHPGDNTRATMTFTVCYAVGADNAHPEESWKLVNFLTNKDGAQYVANNSFGPMPTRASAADAWLAHFSTAMQPFVDGAAYAKRWQFPVGFQPFLDSINSGLQQAFDGQMLPEDVLSASQQTGEQIMQAAMTPASSS